MREPLRRAGGALLLGGIAFGLFLDAGRFGALAPPGQIGPGFWPRLVLIGLMVSALVNAAASLRRPSRPSLAAVPLAREFRRGRLALAGGLILGYIGAIELVGFLLATSAFLAAFMALAGLRRPVSLLLIAAIGAGLLTAVFVRVVYLPLPKGWGPFEDVTLTLYRLLRLI
jgi:putative tricarboxylic transport membrane protein